MSPTEATSEMYGYFIVLIVGLVHVRADNAPTVTTAKGIIRGVRSEDGNYNMFMGIPYAKVDEANPFGTSSSYPPFDKVFDANDDSSKCPQFDEFNNTVVGNIDCLRLNIYTPTYANTTSRLPVFVYIYGGKFEIGFYSRDVYGPKYLVRYDIILILINYRLGPFGFMCLDIPEVPGNQGLKDQIMALRWIQSHIIAFGGDPDKVTIGGNSAGASAIDHHIYRDNNQEKLYNQAILQSVVKFYSYPKPVKDAPIILARYYQFITDDIYQAIAFLATIPSKDIIIATTILGSNALVFEACLEKKFSGVESYATVEWSEQKPMAANMSFIIGNNDDETGLEGSRDSLSRALLTNILGNFFNTRQEEFQGMSELIERFYLVSDSFGLNVAKLYSDIRYLYQSYRNMRKFIEYDAAAVYMYNFTYVGTKNFIQRLNHKYRPKSFHADEIGYLFDMGFTPEEPTATDQLVIDKMTTLWANFVKYGDPTPEITELIDVKWKPVTPTSTFNCLKIDSNLTLTTSSFADKVMFWDLFHKIIFKNEN